jgi:glycosyltransferase involved in cell wall biosynthesis
MFNKTVLVVAYYFPPIAASGSMRPLGFCRYLDRYGWRPRVLTTEPKSVYPPTGVDESLCGQVPNSIQIDRVPHKNPEQTLLQVRNRVRGAMTRLLSSGGTQPLTNANGHTLDGPQVGFREQYLNLKTALLDWLFSFPDPQCFWLRPAVERFSRIPRDEYPDAVFATGGPWTTLLVGKALAKRFQVPFVADLRDPWTCNPYIQVRSPFLFRRAAQLERSVYEAAACVIANTAELRVKLLIDHPDLENKFITITNGFDGGTYNPAANEGRVRQSPGVSVKPPIELCHFGSVYGNRNPLLFLQAVKELIDEKRIGPDRLRIRFTGAWEVTETSCENLAQELEQLGIVRREPSVPHNECVQLMMVAEILLILQPASPLQIPGKIYEYIATGRPLLVIGGEGATAQLVERHQLGAFCRNEIADIKTMLARIVNGHVRITPPPKEELAGFEYRTLTADLASVLDAVCAAKQIMRSVDRRASGPDYPTPPL